ncbi:hypothetical protein PENTCL1PPCAC_14457 [Pristionchus entomophagus]|uniref:Lipase n=1 Tax=Pristionchus entomophagus TaxID=358040 RepID=A0AAV5TDA2_9BILA|nr:hypothetical protein PENTCL1PPCAC_14457 [Pristionchus entomophagus]
MLAHVVLMLSNLLFTVSSDPEMSMTVPQIIDRWGYPFESHEVITEDGYILSIFRITHGLNSSDSVRTCPPIIMDPSLLCDSSEFIMNPPESSPAMILADAGFDVFLMNHRGTTYSRKHRDFSTSDSRYWKFTIDEYAKYDNTAVIDYVLNLTSDTSLYWLGHSQGTTLGFMMLSERLDYNKKIRAMFQIAPPGTAHFARGLVRIILLIYHITKPLTDLYQLTMGSHEVGISNRAIPQMITSFFCATPYIDQICRGAMHFLLGPQSMSFNLSRWPVYVSHLPSSTSSWNMLHWFQIATHEKLEHFSGKHSGNSDLPLDTAYDLSRVLAPVYIFCSSSDWLVTPRDIEEDLLPLLKRGVVKGVFRVPGYNHLDFVLATDNAEKVFSRIIDIVEKQETDIRKL